ncbi:MAG: AraC family transcriptional regulator [Defluviitaleaceae bacterium]|nr:AraC family transcriptional regulator [Defluviitaleaceae bacterium]
MDWLKGMNGIAEYIETNLTQTMQYATLSKIVGCSVYEFSRIFSFMAGMYISEYIRRRRLSQAVFDIQNSNDKIIGIALKYCYESSTAFSRAFRELHGTSPISARRESVTLKTCL